MNHKYSWRCFKHLWPSHLLFSHRALFRIFLIVGFLAAAKDDFADEYVQRHVEADNDEKIGPDEFTTRK